MVKDIDFVITWVDMDDPKWQAEFAKYSGRKENTKNGVSKARFRDYGFLKYWFRGVEKFAPWVRKIHFVTSGQKPDWLDVSNPKINLVNHQDYIFAALDIIGSCYYTNHALGSLFCHRKNLSDNKTHRLAIHCLII